MSLKERLQAIGLGWSWPISWTGAQADKCLEPGCGARRDQHEGKNHRFVEEK